MNALISVPPHRSIKPAPHSRCKNCRHWVLSSPSSCRTCALSRWPVGGSAADPLIEAVGDLLIDALGEVHRCQERSARGMTESARHDEGMLALLNQQCW